MALTVKKLNNMALTVKKLNTMALTVKKLNTLRGEAVHRGLTIPEAKRLFTHVDTLEKLLDEADLKDALGTEGWRHRAGIADV